MYFKLSTWGLKGEACIHWISSTTAQECDITSVSSCKSDKKFPEDPTPCFRVAPQGRKWEVPGFHLRQALSDCTCVKSLKFLWDLLQQRLESPLGMRRFKGVISLPTPQLANNYPLLILFLKIIT